ncbi:MAG: hypothetical protein ACAI44_35830 [Candidatus Sericytochromatia bacterium]
MSFTPPFMQHFETFDRARRAIHTLEEWQVFKQHWFDKTDWPDKNSKAQLIREDIQKRELIAQIQDGRRWGPGYWLVDLTAEARYEYFWTLYVIGEPLENPRWNTVKRTEASGWYQECRFCEIFTPDLGSEVCPNCGRAMYYVWAKD